MSTTQSLTDEADELIAKYYSLQEDESSSKEEIKEILEALAAIAPLLCNYDIQKQAVLTKLIAGDQ